MTSLLLALESWVQQHYGGRRKTHRKYWVLMLQVRLIAEDLPKEHREFSGTPQWKSVPVQDNHINDISEAVSLIFPDLEKKPICAKNCYYTMSIDESFLIDRSQTMESVYFASVCSGHGFKFAPAIGDALANMAFERQCAVPLSEFGVQRFNSISCKF